MPPKTATQPEPEIPAPSTDATKTRSWLSLSNPDRLDDKETVLHNNMEFLCAQNVQTHAFLESLKTDLRRMSRRSSGASSAGSSAGATEEGAAEVEDENGQAGLISAMKENFWNLLKDQHEAFIKAEKKTLYKTKKKECMADATQFRAHMNDAGSEMFGEEWEEHPLNSYLAQATSASWVIVYLDLCRDHPDFDKAKPKSALKSTEKAQAADDGTKGKGERRVSTGTKSGATDSQQTIASRYSPDDDNDDEPVIRRRRTPGRTRGPSAGRKRTATSSAGGAARAAARQKQAEREEEEALEVGDDNEDEHDE